MRFAIAAALVGVAVGSFAPQVESSLEAFHNFRKSYGKVYDSIEELQLRRSIFLENYEKALEHNKKYEAGQVSWYKKVHSDMDLTPMEWMKKRVTGGLPPLDRNIKMKDTLDERILSQLDSLGPTPRDFDWVSKGAVSSVKDQGRCGSCSAFSAVGAIESCFKIKTGQLNDDLSEQYLLDCGRDHVYNDEEGSWGASGCNGAWPQAYFDFVSNQTLQEEDFYRYVSGYSGQDFNCNPRDDGFYEAAMVSGMMNKWYTNELDMEKVVRINPVSTSVQIPNPPDDWYDYGGGVLDAYYCCDAAYDSDCVNHLNHAILVVGFGYDSYSGLDYWIIKNSWGDWWGENGYLKLKKGTGHCGVGSLHQTIPYCEAV